MAHPMRDSTEPFETWLLRRVAEAIEGNEEVSANLLTELRTALAEVRARPPEARDSLARMELAERVNLPADYLTELLAALEAQPAVARERFLHRLLRRGWSTNGKPTRPSITEVRRVKVLGGKQAVPLEDVVLAQAIQLEALMNVLGRQGMITKTEVLVEIKQLQAKTPMAR